MDTLDFLPRPLSMQGLLALAPETLDSDPRSAESPIHAHTKAVCGAFMGRDENGAARFCRSPQVRNGWCKLHWDHHPKKVGKLNRPGNMYSQHLNEAERDLYAEMELGKLEHEIKLMRITLLRELERKRKIEAANATKDPLQPFLQVTDRIKRTDIEGNDSYEVRAKEYDPDTKIHAIINMIEKLERSHKYLQEQMGADGRLIIIGGLPSILPPGATPSTPTQTVIEHQPEDTVPLPVEAEIPEAEVWVDAD